jgi:hypothetical protein
VSKDNGVSWEEFASFADMGRAVGIAPSTLRACAAKNYENSCTDHSIHGVICVYIDTPIKYNTILTKQP